MNNRETVIINIDRVSLMIYEGRAHYLQIGLNICFVIQKELVLYLIIKALQLISYYLQHNNQNTLEYNMQQHQTLHQYIELRNIQRKKQNYVLNQQKHYPNPLPMDKAKKIDSLMLQIFQFIKTLIGEGPIFQKFRVKMQQLYKIFERELSQFHNIQINTKLKADNRVMQEIQSSNNKLKEYLQKCQRQKDQAAKKLDIIKQHNTYDKLAKQVVANHQKLGKREQIIDVFDDEVAEVPKKAINMINFDNKNQNEKNKMPNEKEKKKEQEISLINKLKMGKFKMTQI